MKLLTAISKFFREPAPKIAPAVQLMNDPVLALLAATLQEHGFEAAEMNGFLALSSGIELRVEFLELVELANDNVRTSTRITASHVSYFPKGLPEFQHSAGNSAEVAISDGFSSWAKTDLVALLDSIREKPNDCTYMEMNFSPTTSEKSTTRRVVFGPTSHLASSTAQAEEEHPFCPCCLFTQNFEAFKPVLDSDETVGIRLFASRDGNGEISADCRVNGDDYSEGAARLMEYVRSWPLREGLEFRKQYVVIRSVESAGEVSGATS